MNIEQEIADIQAKLDALILAAKKPTKETALNNKEQPEYSIVRGDRSGVFFGVIERRKGQEVTMSDCRILHWWEGAAACPGLALYGTSDPDGCRFTGAVNVMILDAVEILPCTRMAVESLKAVKEWKP